MRALARSVVCCIVLGVWGDVAHAQSTSPQTTDPIAEPLRDKQQELFVEGVRRMNTQDWAGAYVSLLAAWRLEKRWSIAANLGGVELKLGKYREAAEHLAFASGKIPNDDAHRKGREKVDRWLAEAKTHVAAVTIRVDVVAADLMLDGTWFGRSPWSDTIFLEPGQHAIEARSGAKTTAQSVTVAGGSTKEVLLTLNTDPARSTEDPAGARSSVAGPPSGLPERPRDPSDVGTSSPTRTIVLVGTSVLAAASIATWVGFSAKASSANDDAERFRAEAQSKFGPAGCSTSTDPTCISLRDALDRHDSARSVATAGLVGTIVFGAGALGTLLLWPTSTKPSVALSAGPQGWQLGMKGTFE